MVKDRTISKARKPTISTVSSLARRSRWEGRLRNSRNRLAGRFDHELQRSILRKRETCGVLLTFAVRERGLSAV